MQSIAFKELEVCLFHQLSNFNMQNGLQDGSQNTQKNVFMYIYACIPRAIRHFFGNLHNNILGIHLCIMSVQSNFGHNPLSAKSLDVLSSSSYMSTDQTKGVWTLKYIACY